MNKVYMSLVLFCFSCELVVGQSALDGTSFQVSTYNLPGSVGVVRLVDTADSECLSEAGTPVGDDAALETCLVEDSGMPPVEMTFNGGPQTIGELTVIPTATPFEGVDPNEPIVAVNNESGLNEAMATWSTSGDLLEFRMRTTDNVFPANVEDDFFGFAATGIQYPNAAPDSEVGFFRDEELDTYNNFYFWFENADGPISGYDIFIPVGIGVGRHPIEQGREVVYIFYSDGEVDQNTDTVAGGSLDFYSHGSDLNGDPSVGNLLNLADFSGIDGLEITGFGIGMLVQPPELLSSGPAGDFDNDGQITAADMDLLSAQVGGSEAAFDLTGDGTVTQADREFWVTDVANTFFGDADLDGAVAFADFLLLSDGFGGPGGWSKGDFNGSGDIEFADFLLLSNNFGQTRPAATQSVPEPTSSLLVCMGLMFFIRWLRK